MAMQLDTISAAQRLHNSMKKYMATGNDQKHWADNDEDRSQIKDIMRKNIEVKAIINDGIGFIPQELNKTTQDAYELEKNIVDILFAKALEAGKTLVETIKPWAQGYENEESWFADLDETSTWAATLRIAKTTLLVDKSPADYMNAKKQLQKAKNDIDYICGLFDRQDESDLTMTMTALTKTLSITFIEGLLMTPYSTNTDTDEHKKKTHTIKRSCKSHDVMWDSVFKSVRERATLAARMSMPE